MRTITAKEAQQQLGIPATTIRAWASKGRMFAKYVATDGQRHYLLGRVLQLRDEAWKRKVGGHERRV